jgi:hypothetical protein
MVKKDSYTVEWVEVCYTCDHHDVVEDVLVCGLDHEQVSPLGICDKYTEERS